MVTALQEVVEIINRIRPLLAGREPAVQGAVLAECLAIWLNGHHVEGDAEATRKMRTALLEIHIAAVRGLVDINPRKS